MLTQVITFFFHKNFSPEKKLTKNLLFSEPAYQNLKKRVETNVQGFLDQQEWRTDSNRNQMREKLRKYIAE